MELKLFAAQLETRRELRLFAAQPETPIWTEVARWRDDEDRELECLQSPEVPWTPGTLIQAPKNFYLVDHAGQVRCIKFFAGEPVGPAMLELWWTSQRLSDWYELLPTDLDRGCPLHRRMVRAALEVLRPQLDLWERTFPSEGYIRPLHGCMEAWVTGDLWLGTLKERFNQASKQFDTFYTDDGQEGSQPAPQYREPLRVAHGVLRVWDLITRPTQPTDLFLALSHSHPFPMFDTLRRWIPFRDVILEHARRYPKL